MPTKICQKIFQKYAKKELFKPGILVMLNPEKFQNFHFKAQVVIFDEFTLRMNFADFLKMAILMMAIYFKNLKKYT